MANVLQIEIKPVCPGCGSESYINNGRDGAIIYRVCRACGHRGPVHRMTQEQLTAMLAREEIREIDVRVISVTVRGGQRD